ncbi:MAG: PBP1A family penicillin-binding protein [Pseudomonadota bacterium]
MKLSLAVFALTSALTVPPAGAAWELPPLDRVLHYQPKQPLQVFTADGVEIAAFGAERRQFVPIAQMPKLLQDAVIAVEDTRFREHGGIDPKGMARAALAMLTGGRRQGASTITQQVARTFFLTQRFTAERKLQEIRIALEIEKQLSKDRILELYLNEIFLGQRAYGFAAASQVYFGKPLAQLSIAETAMLAGLPQNPHYANPIANRERATQRQRLVLERMRATGVISEAQHAAARAEKLAIRAPGQVPLHAEHVAEMARRVVVERFGTEAYSSGIRVMTSLRAAEQQAAFSALRRGVLAHDRKGAWRGPEDQESLPDPQSGGDGAELERAAAQALKDHRDDEQLRVAIVLAASPRELRVQLASGERITLAGESLRWAQPALAAKARAPLALKRGAVVRVMRQGDGWTLTQWPDVQAAFVALDPASGRVRALVGGFDFTRQPFNHVTQAWRQPGSAFKPLLYSAALEHGVMPATLVDDAPFTGANGWSPQNSDGRFDGPLTLREALAKSKNLVSVRLLQQLGTATARDWAARFGLDAERQPDNLTLALGSGSVTPMQMAQAYAALANGGWRVDPVLVERITDAQGKVLFDAAPPLALGDAARALPARNVFVTTSLLGDVTRVGTAARAQRELRRPDVYGKTGTTNDAVDAWFAGFQAGRAAVAWMGYDEPRSLGERESGGGLALPIWIEYMATALKGVPIATPGPPPEGLLQVGDDWFYSEWVDGGWVQRISADGTVVKAAPPATSAPLPRPVEQSTQ